MPSTFTTNTGIEKIADGEQSGLWGQTTNLNFDIVDRALNGSTTVTLSGTTHTLTTANGVLSDGQFAVLVFTGSLGAPNTVTINPNTAQKLYWVTNTTSQDVILSQGSGTNVTVPPGATKAVYSDGAGAGAAVVDLTAVFFGNVTGNLTGNVTGDLTGNVTGNADTATLAADATKLATTRAFTIGGTARNFDGTAAVTWSIADINAQLDALAALATNGLITRTAANTIAARSLVGTTNQIAVSNGDGVSGNPTVSAVVADKATAEAGTDNTRLMTPLRTNEAIAALAPAPAQLTQTQAEDPASTVFGTVSGQRLEQQTNAAFNVTGSAPKFACRAWVNFNGTTTTPSIRASGNVSSVARNATGKYTINLATALPDADYSVVGSTRASSDGRALFEIEQGTIPTASSVRIVTLAATGVIGSNDTNYVFAAFFR
jgi:hypothetical protein